MPGAAVSPNLREYFLGAIMTLVRMLAVVGGVMSLAFATPALSADPTPPVTAAAPSPRSLELAKRYMAATHMERAVDQAMTVMMPIMRAQMDKSLSKLTAEERSTIYGIVDDTMQDFMKQSIAKLQVRMPPILVRNFTERELEEIVVFYESPTGQTALTKGPAMMAELMPIMMEDAAKIQGQMLAKLCAAYPAQCRGEVQKGATSPRAS